MSRERVLGSDGLAHVGRRRHFFTMDIFYPANVFAKDPVVEGELQHLRQSARDHRFAIHAYCFMPNQVSLLLEGLSGSSALRRFVLEWKERSTLDYRETTGMELWQRGHVDQSLHSGERTDEVARHIIETPVRDGLVATSRDYRYSGSDTRAATPYDDPAHRGLARPADGRSDPALSVTG